MSDLGVGLSTPSSVKKSANAPASDRKIESPVAVEEPEPQSAQAAKPKVWVRVFALIAVLFTGWHVFASFLWIAPYSQNAREVVPGEMLTNKTVDTGDNYLF